MHCKYDIVEITCADCADPLCNMCGYIVKGKRYCNECYEFEKQEKVVNRE